MHSHCHSLYHSLLAQHPRQLTPIRCASSTIDQLRRFFEEVVLENNLGALVVDGFASGERTSSGEASRVRALIDIARDVFLFANESDSSCAGLRRTRAQEPTNVVILEQTMESSNERFVVIADARFSALLSSVRDPADNSESGGDLVVWTFEPDVVYSALEYLMARVTAEYPIHAASFARAVQNSMPKATSLQLTLAVTTKLARLLQKQAEREIAVNRIATAIRNSLELDCLLATAANEVARALNVKCCAVQIEDDLIGHTMTKSCFRVEPTESEQAECQLMSDIELAKAELTKSRKMWLIDGDDSRQRNVCSQVAVPLIHHGNCVGLLLVQGEDIARVWVENELLLLNTVADQLIVAVSQAHLFAQAQRQALTDELTGCFNRRAFEIQLERDLHLATRMRQPLSLIMMDLDNFKLINDQSGHDVGDVALRKLAENIRAELRAVDSAARFGGDEFVVILPQASIEGALIVADRLRKRVASTEVPGFGFVTASFGLASFPVHGSSRNSLVVAADRALYRSKGIGSSQISIPLDDPCELETLHPITLTKSDEVTQTYQTL